MAGAGGQEVGRISIRVVPNTDRFRSELRAQLEAIEQGLKVEIPVDVDAGKAKAELAELARNRKATINVDVDRGPLDRLKGVLSSFDTGGAGNGGRFLAPFVDNLALAGAIAAIAAPALALVTGALAALPAIAAGVATPIAVIALGLDGIKKAAEQLKTPLDGLKKSVSGVFETRLTPVFGQLAEFLPKLDGPLQSVANGISDVAKSFVDTISGGPGLAKIQDTISNIAAAISTAAPGIGRLTDGLLGLADKVSSKFPAVSKWFNEAADSFANWVDKATADGSLDRAMGNLGTTLKGVLDIVGDLAKQGFEWLQDPKFAQSMKDFVSNFQTLLRDVLPGLGGFFEQLSGALDGIIPVLDKVNSFKPPAWMNLDSDKPQGGFGGFPGMQPLPEGKGAIPETANSFQATIAVIEGKFLEMWSRIKLQAATAFVDIGTTIGTAFSTALGTLQSAAGSAFNGVVTTASGVVAQVIAQFAQIPSRLAGVWSSLAGAAAGGFAGVVAAAAAGMANVISTVASAVGQVISVIASIPGKAAGALAGLAGVGAAAGAALMNGLLGGIKAGLSAVLSFAAGIAAKIAAVKGPLPKDRTTLTPAGQALMQGLQDGMEGGLQGVLARASEIGKQIADAINAGTAGATLGTLPDQLNKSLDELELSRKDLKVQKDALPADNKDGRKSLTDQMAQLQTLKDQLNLQKEQLGFSDKYGDSVDANKDSQTMMADSLNKVVDIGKGFAMANANQFMSDLGMSGKGAIPTIAGLGLDWASGMLSKAVTGGMGGGTTINVGSVDDALSAKQTIDNRKALQYKNR